MNDQGVNFDNSAETKEIAAALCKAQAVLGSVTLNKEGKITFKSGNGGGYTYKYADLAAVWDGIRKPLTDNGIAVVQIPSVDYTEVNQEFGVRKGIVSVTTKFMHQSGQFVSCTITLMAKDDNPQSVGSAITYGRRYGISCLAGVTCEEDDDGAAAQDDKPGRSVATTKKGGFKAPTEQQAPEGEQVGPNEESPPHDDIDEPYNKPAKAEPQKQNGSTGNRPMSDAERKRLGLITATQNAKLTTALKAASVPGAQWKAWLKSVYGFESAADIKADAYEGVLAVVTKNSDQIKNFEVQA